MDVCGPQISQNEMLVALVAVRCYINATRQHDGFEF